ncbi:MAG: histidinol-phosphatase HisJ family protein [Thermoleophilia bacterium]|nr:histidinol-phosphatase HisJ family protein [Thermoleophilia bacterium]
MRLPDYHTHTARCGHARGRPADYVAAARARGLSAIGIADHLPLLPEPDAELSMSVCDLGDYVAEVQELKTADPGYVLLGVEADYRPHTISGVRSLLEEHPFDYTIGSIHHLGEWGFDDPRQIDEYEDRDIDDVWVEYLELVGDAAETGLFTILGHLDLVKKFGYRPTRTLKVELDHLVSRIARAGVLVEINTAGLHRPVKEAYPTADILARLNEAGVAITFGSDAHRPEEVGRDFAHAVDLAHAAGYTEFASLEIDPAGGRAFPRLRSFAQGTRNGGGAAKPGTASASGGGAPARAPRRPRKSTGGPLP